MGRFAPHAQRQGRRPRPSISRLCWQGRVREMQLTESTMHRAVRARSVRPHRSSLSPTRGAPGSRGCNARADATEIAGYTAARSMCFGPAAGRTSVASRPAADDVWTQSSPSPLAWSTPRVWFDESFPIPGASRPTIDRSSDTSHSFSFATHALNQACVAFSLIESHHGRTASPASADRSHRASVLEMCS